MTALSQLTAGFLVGGAIALALGLGLSLAKWVRKGWQDR